VTPAKRRRAAVVPAVPPAPAAGRGRPVSAWPRPAGAIGIALVVIAAAWLGADRLARRARGADLPPLTALLALPEAAREPVRAAAARAQAAPDSADVVGELGRALHAALMSEDAISAYAKAERLDAAAWRWPYLRGVLLEERSRLDEARAAFESAIDRNGAHGLASFRLAEIAFKEGRLDDAEQGYRRAAEASPSSPFLPGGVTARRVFPLSVYAQLGLARVALERRQTAAASAIIDAVIAAQPTFGPAHTLRARLEDHQDAAVPSTARAYVPPNDPDVDGVVAMSAMRDLLLKHAAVAARGGDREWREFLIRRAMQFNPRDPNVLMEAATMLQASNRATEALEVLQQHERLVPGDHHTLVEEGRCLADLGRLEEAEAVLRRAVRVRDAAAEYNLGTVLDRQGRSEEARARYENALTIDPFHARALNNLGVWWDRHGQSEIAIRTLLRAIQADPENADAYSNLGSAYIGARRLPDALRALATAVALAPEAPDAHNNLGIALAQSGRFAEAETEWRAALRLNPDHLNARRNLDRIGELRGPAR
jgi:tetratricopeptide (TPR) repeat protein